MMIVHTGYMTTKRTLLQFEAYSDKTIRALIPMMEWNSQETIEQALPVFLLAALDEWAQLAADHYGIKPQIFSERVRMHLQRHLLNERAAGG